VFGLSGVDFPDLANAKSAIKDRQKELYNQVQALSANETSYKRSESYGKLGQFYHVHDYLKVAIQLYDKSLELAPTNSKWHYLKAMAYRNLGEFDNVKAGLKQAWKYNDQYIPTMIHLGEVYLQEGYLEEAKKAYQQALKINQQTPRALVGLGQILMQQGQVNQAIEKYKKALELQPFATNINFLISQAYAANGDLEQAQKYNKIKGSLQAQMNDPLMVDLFEESRSASYYNDKAARALMSKQYESAEVWARTALGYDPQSPYPKVTLANLYIATGRVNQAAELIKGVDAENVKDPNLKYTLGVIEEMLGKNDKAIYWYRKVIELDPGHKQASVTLANSLMRAGEYDKAMIQLNKASDLDSENAHLLHRMASIHAYKNECSQATDKIYKAVKLQPKSFAFLLTLSKIAVHCPVSEQVLKDALNATRNMYQISQDTYVVETLAMIEAKNNHFKEALDYQAQAIFQLLSIDKNSNKINELKLNLDLYKKNTYPKGLFKENDIDLNPKSFSIIK
jgi:tetratricopeptide (TPR) repeat protein